MAISTRVGLALLSLAVMASMVGCAGAASEADRASTPTPTSEGQQGPRFDAVAIACGLTSYSEVLDDGATLEITRVAQDGGGSAGIDEIECMLNKLDAPQSVASKIGQTRALDGRQADEWDGYEISWSYHPDDGASIVVERQD